MTSINIPRDDAASKINTKAVGNRTVTPVEPFPTTQPVKAHEDTIAAPKQQTSKNQQRRKQARRAQEASILLDTRSGHDRRNANNVDSSEEEESNTEKNARTGINVYS